ncbi:MAG: DNA repair protein [Flavobacteriaceae bacterium]|nr:MAG: DNA repair protein [Flavobacteriaceae bacterium]
MNSSSESQTQSFCEQSSRLKLHSHIDNYKSKLLKQIPISKIQLSYQPEIPVKDRIKILDSGQSAETLRSLWNPDTLELQEQFMVLYLNNRNQIIGYYPHSSGTMTQAMIDMRLILATALGCGAVSMILSHNHPSSNPKPSKADHILTQKISKASKTIDITLLDHIILTKDSHYSFADNGEIDF